VLTYSSTEDDHPRPLGLEGDIVDPSNIADYVNDQSWVLVRVEIDHVSERAVCKGWTEDGDIILQSNQHNPRKKA
jgi:hypothetical protein